MPDMREHRSGALEPPKTENVNAHRLDVLQQVLTLDKGDHERSRGDVVCVVDRGEDGGTTQVLVCNDSQTLRASMTTTGSNTTQIAGVFRDEETLMRILALTGRRA